MRRIILLSCLLLSLVAFTACSSSEPKTGAETAQDLKAKLTELKKEREKLNAEITSMEAKLNLGKPGGAVKRKLVGVEKIEKGYFEHNLVLQGLVESEQNITVSAQTSGIATHILVSEGQKVAKGQVLAKLDSSVLKASLEEVQTSLMLAESLFKRQEALWKQKIGTEVQYLTSKSNRDACQKKLETLRRQLRNTRIIAPISGTIDEVVMKLGEMFSAGSPAFRIVNDSRLKVRVNVAERYIGVVKKGNPVEITFNDVNLKAKSFVSFVSRSIEARSRTFAVNIPLRPQALIKPNMVCVVKIINYTNKEAISVPINLIQYLNGQATVLCLEKIDGQEKAGTVVRKVVTVGSQNDDRAEIKSGLEVGQTIITQGIDQVNEGEIVDISSLNKLRS